MAAGKNTYLRCPHYKGQPRKHITVCDACRYRKKCLAYLRYHQPELPFIFARKIRTG